MNYKKLRRLNRGLYIHIVNMTKSGTNRHLEIHEKTIEEQTKNLPLRSTCFINLSLILKLEVDSFKHN